MSRNLVHRNLYVLLLTLLAVAMPISNYVMNMAWVFLLANWVIEWDMKAKFADFRSNRLLHAVFALVAVHVVGMLWSTDWAYGLDDLRKKLPMLAVPLVVLTSRPLDRKEMRIVLFGFVTTLFVVTIIGLVRYETIPDLPYREIVPYISHIRFCLMLTMGICLLVGIAYGVLRKRSKGLKLAHAIVSLVLVMWWLLFLFLMQSYTSLIVLSMVAVVSLLVYWKRIENKVWKVSCLVMVIVVVSVSAMWLTLLIRDYYRPTELTRQPLAVCTVNGNPYSHKLGGVMECGGYIESYVCRKELLKEWPKYSAVPIDQETANGYTVYPTLIRYLNAMGVAKDSAGMTHLSSKDVELIERGVANPVYSKSVSLRRMVYVLLYERENYIHEHSVCNFTMLQRFELWRNGWAVFVQHPLFGVGTGDVVDCCHEQLALDDSPLAGTSKHTHNQYLTFLITFGLVGFVIIVVVMVYPFVGMVKRNSDANFPLLAIGVITLVSFLSEDTLETLAGILLVVFFLSLFYRTPWNMWHEGQ